MTEQLSGIWLSFTPQETEEIWNAVEDDGYDPSIDGLKKWILDRAREEPDPGTPTDRVMRTVRDYLREHPEETRRLGEMGRNAVAGGIQAILRAMNSHRYR